MRDDNIKPYSEVPLDDAGNKASNSRDDSLQPGDLQKAVINLEEEKRLEAGADPPSIDSAQLISAINSVLRILHSLDEGFESKLKYDASKERIIDMLHRELEIYREGLHFQIMRPLFLDLIAMHDDLANLLKYHKNGEGDGGITSKLLQSLASFQDTIESILERHGVLAFNEPGDRFVPQRQRVMRTEITDDLAKDRMICERLRKGFEYEGKVLRPEVVSLYKSTVLSIPDNSSKEEQT